VKRVCADDSVPFAHAKVGYRQAIFGSRKPRARKSAGFFCWWPAPWKLRPAIDARRPAPSFPGDRRIRWTAISAIRILR
jgi:hypothetical protein